MSTTSHAVAGTRILTETTCWACEGSGLVAKPPGSRKSWNCETCEGKKVTRRAVTLTELRDALDWAPRGKESTLRAQTIEFAACRLSASLGGQTISAETAQAIIDLNAVIHEGLP